MRSLGDIDDARQFGEMRVAGEEVRARVDCGGEDDRIGRREPVVLGDSPPPWTAMSVLKDVTTHSVENAIVSSAASSDTSRASQRASSYCTMVGTIQPFRRWQLQTPPSATESAVDLATQSKLTCRRRASVAIIAVAVVLRCWLRALCRRAPRDPAPESIRTPSTFVDERDLLAGPPSQSVHELPSGLRFETLRKRLRGGADICFTFLPIDHHIVRQLTAPVPSGPRG